MTMATQIKPSDIPGVRLGIYIQKSLLAWASAREILKERLTRAISLSSLLILSSKQYKLSKYL
ncbi:hypothetical protein GQX74_006139 [Glossina fuscipes]|nr:hypothetical protein GQX74_006139 [Glossina fuscipes]